MVMIYAAILIFCCSSKIYSCSSNACRKCRWDSSLRLNGMIDHDSLVDGSNLPNTSSQCKIRHSNVINLHCFGQQCDSRRYVMEGTMVHFSCPPYYEADPPFSLCHNGSWSHPINCRPVCGMSFATPLPLIRYGLAATFGQWPWAASIYHQKHNKWENMCGATLISDTAVLTAAHCVWNIAPQHLLVGLGNLLRTLPASNDSTSISKVNRVFVLPVYRQDANFYNSDIAIITLQSPVALSSHILPACLPNEHRSVAPYTSAVVSGWGLDENRKETELKFIKVPIVDIMKCLKHVPGSFNKYMSYTSFCAGYVNEVLSACEGNSIETQVIEFVGDQVSQYSHLAPGDIHFYGTGVCNGDSGNGLLTKVNGKWVIQGIVSMSPRRGTSRYCHPRSYSLYTKVYIYKDWISHVLNFEDSKRF